MPSTVSNFHLQIIKIENYSDSCSHIKLKLCNVVIPWIWWWQVSYFWHQDQPYERFGFISMHFWFKANCAFTLVRDTRLRETHPNILSASHPPSDSSPSTAQRQISPPSYGRPTRSYFVVVLSPCIHFYTNFNRPQIRSILFSSNARNSRLSMNVLMMRLKALKSNGHLSTSKSSSCSTRGTNSSLSSTKSRSDKSSSPASSTAGFGLSVVASTSSSLHSPNNSSSWESKLSL